MEGEGQVNIFQFQGVFGAVARIERSGRCSGGCHILLSQEVPWLPDSLSEKIQDRGVENRF